MVKEKCQADLIRAVSYSKYSDRIQLIIAGDGPQKNKLTALGKNMKNPPIMRFFQKEELVHMINYCDLYAQASYAEIECIACVEAITCGLVPVIANSEMSAARLFALTEDNLYVSGDTDSLADKIDHMIENPELREELKQKYIQFAARFQIERCIDKMEEMFRDAIAQKRRQED